MPITGIFNPRKCDDIHVVSGHPSYELWAHYVQFSTAALSALNPPQSISAQDYLQHENDVQLEFFPRFTGTYHDADDHPEGQASYRADFRGHGILYRGHGVLVNRRTGHIAVANALPIPRLRNFIMEVEVRDIASGTVHRFMYRVHVHHRIDSISITPPELAIHRHSASRDETGYRFTVLATFDDGVVGDITDNEEVHWEPQPRNVDEWGYLFIHPTATTNQVIDIRVTINYAPTRLNATAHLKVLDTWAASGPLVAIPLPGGATLQRDPATGLPPVIAFDRAPNILFLGDGFTLAQKDDFQKFANGMVDHLRHVPWAQPYGHLSGSINYWCAFVPSTNEGVSIGSEVASGTSASGSIFQDHLPPPASPPSPFPADQTLTNGQKTFLVGLPVEADDLSHMATRSNANIVADWIALYGVDPTPMMSRDPDPGARATAVTLAIENWRRLAARGLVEEIDSPLGISNGSREFGDYNEIRFMADRMTRDRLNDLLAALVGELHDNTSATVHVPIGHLFTPGATGTLPKDYDLVLIAVPGHGRANNGDGYFLMNMHDEISILGISGIYTIFNSPLVPAELKHAELLAHELSHSFFLGDEYGEFDGPPSAATSGLVDPHEGNLMEDGQAMAAGVINGDEIRWLWHRIERAGVIENITPQGANLLVNLQLGQGARFSPRMILHFRERSTTGALPKQPKVSAPFEVVSNTLDSVVLSPSATAFNYPAASLIGHAAVAATFPAGSIIYVPVRAPDPVSGVLEPVQLVAPNVKAYITGHGAPLTAWPSVKDDNTVQVPILDRVRPGVSPFALPVGFRAIDRPRIIGLYSGGRSNHAGVLHPSGNCVMRTTNSVTDPAVAVSHDLERSREFCHVCQYILVDLIDPTKHGDIDREYATRYPLA